jgi:hypothetical protein
MSDFNLDDFNTKNENLLKEKAPKKEKKQGRPKKQNTLTKKLQISVSDEEYAKLYKQFESSEFPNFASYMRLQLKKKDII